MSEGPTLVTLDQMAERLGWRDDERHRHAQPRARRLKRYLKRRQAQVGAKLMRATGDGYGRRYRVDEAALREHCPELFGSSVDELQAQFRRHLIAIDAKIDQRLDRFLVERVRPEISRVERSTNVALLELAKRLDLLAGP